MLGNKIKVQSKVVSDYTDEQLLFINRWVLSTYMLYSKTSIQIMIL